MLPALAVMGVLTVLASQSPSSDAPREAAPVEAVSVTGSGRVTLPPDRAVFTAGVSSAAPSAAQAVQENSKAMTAVVEALKKAGAVAAEIRTSQLSIYPEMDSQPGREPRITGYRVNNSVTVTRKEVKDVPRLLQAAVDAGANQVSGISFLVSDPARGREQGLKDAFADARAKALTLAQAAGRELGRAIAITEGAADSPQPMYRRARQEMVAAAADMPVEAGTEELSFTVSVTFELR